MDWLLLVLPILVAVQLWLMYLIGHHIGRKRGYVDGYDVGYTEASRYYCQEGKRTKPLADGKRDSDAGGQDIAHTVTGSEHS